jgi:hypothetical protein
MSWFITNTTSAAKSDTPQPLRSLRSLRVGVKGASERARRTGVVGTVCGARDTGRNVPGIRTGTRACVDVGPGRCCVTPRFTP